LKTNEVLGYIAFCFCFSFNGYWRKLSGKGEGGDGLVGKSDRTTNVRGSSIVVMRAGAKRERERETERSWRMHRSGLRKCFLSVTSSRRRLNL
jgi:hypothetical protein